MSIEVANESGVAVDESALASVARHVLAAMQVNPSAELSIMVVTTELQSGQRCRSRMRSTQGRQ